MPAGRSGAGTEKSVQAGGGNCDKKDKRHTECVSEDVKEDGEEKTFEVLNGWIFFQEKNKIKDSNQHILKAQEIQRNADLGAWTRVKSEQRQRS